MTISTAPVSGVDVLTKTYHEVEAVRGVSFTVARGKVFGFHSPNGHGTCTTLNLLCTLARPTSRTARVSDVDGPVGQPEHLSTTGATPPSAAGRLPRAAELAAILFDTVAAVCQAHDAPVATGAMPAGVWL